ncbi:MAG: hypothetical protein ACYC7A_17840 [Thermoanaerobaculia bacterium]
MVRVGVILIAFLSLPAAAAEYEGRSLDGQSYSCSAFSYDTGKYYELDVEFSGTEATLTFMNGTTVILEIDDEEIEDPGSISAFDYAAGNYWDLDISSEVVGGGSPSPPRRLAPSIRSVPPRLPGKPVTVDHGTESELAALKELCVSSGDLGIEKEFRESLKLLLEPLKIGEESCGKTATVLFIYNADEKFGTVAIVDRRKATARLLYRVEGSPLQAAAGLFAAFQDARGRRREVGAARP